MNTPGETFREEITNLLADLEAALLELEDHPDDTDLVDTAFRAIHTIKVAGGIFGFHKISEFTHHLANAFDLVRSGELVVTKHLINIALDSGDHIRSLLYDFDSRSGLVAEGRALMDQFGTLLSLGTAAVVAADKPRGTTGHNSQPNATYRIRQAPVVDEGSGNLKVSTRRLNILMDLAGRLLTAQARLNQSANTLADADLTNVAEEIDRLTTELRDNTLAIRTMPIGTTFARFRRLVRDLADELDKEIELSIEGAATELDKTVIDRLGDPLVHLIRNCIDHGIESPAVREAAGKPRKGTLHLSAVHSESSAVIKIKDDGSGFDAVAIRAVAIERGVLAADLKPTPVELYKLVFEAGFSTASSSSGVSERGMGMYVVRRSIESLHGKVWIDSEAGSGSTVTIEMPLTLAIFDGLLVQVGGDRYVLPFSQVEECIELNGSNIVQRDGSPLIEVRGVLVPHVRLREWFDLPGAAEPPAIEQIVVTHLDGQRFGFTVDQVIGQHQTVIKDLGKLYDGVKGLSGATILDDGSVALILDAPKLARCVTAESASIH